MTCSTSTGLSGYCLWHDAFNTMKFLLFPPPEKVSFEKVCRESLVMSLLAIQAGIEN